MIKWDDTFTIVDSSKIQAYMQCPRQYFFEYILGWRSTLPNVHLEFGSAWHLAMEHLMMHGYSEDDVVKAYAIFSKYFREHAVAMIGDDHPKKNLANAFTTLAEYAAIHGDDSENFEVIDTEIAGKVLIEDKPNPLFIFFRIDAAIKGTVEEREGYAVMEHKTGTSLNSSWKNQWLQRTQIGTYYHVANCLLPMEDVLGVVINGAFPSAPIRYKGNGEAYVNDKGPQFHRMLIHKVPAQLEEWRLNTLSYYHDILHDTEVAMETTDDEMIMKCFRKNTEQCTSYFGCPYADFCRAWANPASRAEPVQSGFKVEYWNPQVELAKDAKKVVALGG